jgi:hypothetical protein
MSDVLMLSNKNYERRAWDHYETPVWCTEVLLKHEDFTRVWEPAAGKGAISNVLKAAGVDVYSSDIQDYGFGYDVKDFLLTWENDGRDIVTNPPFAEDLADEFINHALLLTKNFGGRVAFLLRNEFDCASSRQNLFDVKSPFAAKIVLTRRPKWIAGTKGSPRHNYAWYIWDWQWNKYPAIVYDQ